MATLGAAVGQTAPDYKAIVCMFFYGGNDSSNMVLRTDTTSFAEYTRLRNLAPESIALLAPGNAAEQRRDPGLAGPPRRRPSDHAEVHGLAREQRLHLRACIR